MRTKWVVEVCGRGWRCSRTGVVAYIYVHIYIYTCTSGQSVVECEIGADRRSKNFSGGCVLQMASRVQWQDGWRCRFKVGMELKPTDQ